MIQFGELLLQTGRFNHQLDKGLLLLIVILFYPNITVCFTLFLKKRVHNDNDHRNCIQIVLFLLAFSSSIFIFARYLKTKLKKTHVFGCFFWLGPKKAEFFGCQQKSAASFWHFQALQDLHVRSPAPQASPMTRQRTLPGNLQPERTGGDEILVVGKGYIYIYILKKTLVV